MPRCWAWITRRQAALHRCPPTEGHAPVRVSELQLVAEMQQSVAGHQQREQPVPGPPLLPWAWWAPPQHPTGLYQPQAGGEVAPTHPRGLLQGRGQMGGQKHGLGVL